MPVASTTPEASKIPQAGSDGKIADGWVNLPQASTATPQQAADAGSAGTSASYARGDHVHPRGPRVFVFAGGETDETIQAATLEGDLIIRKVSVDE